jgi:hypothetical protein
MDNFSGDIMRRYIMAKGVSFDGRQEEIKKLILGEKLLLVPEPTNPVDPNAISIVRAENNGHIGYVPRDVTDVFHRGWEVGFIFEAFVDSMGEARKGGNIGVKVGIDILREESNGNSGSIH